MKLESSTELWFATSPRWPTLKASSLSRSRIRLARDVALLSLGTLASVVGGPVSAAEVVHACDAKVFEPCPSFSARVNLNEHTVLFDSKHFGYTRGKGSWTVKVAYEPRESCAKVSLFVEKGPLDFDRIYERTFSNGVGTIGDSGVFMYKTGQLETALRVKSSTCYIPKEQSGFSGSPDPALDALDRELDHQLSELGLDARRNGELDTMFDQLALQEQQAKEHESDLALKHDIEEAKRSIEESYKRALREQAERQTRESRVELQRQEEAGESIGTFLQILGTGMTLYNMFNRSDRESAFQGSSQDQAEFQRYLQQLRNSQGGTGSGSQRGITWCRLPTGQCGFINNKGQCEYYDVVGGCQ